MNPLKSFICILITKLLWTAGYSQPQITVVYPKAGQVVTASDSSFIFGSVKPADSEFSINSKRIKIYPNGAFLAMLPLHTGNFTFKCRAVHGNDTTLKSIRIRIPDYLVSTPEDMFQIDTSYIYPRKNLTLMPGDLLHAALKGTPGCRATFTIPGVAENLPMTELPDKQGYCWGEAAFGSDFFGGKVSAAGVYTGVYIINPWDWAAKTAIRFKLQNTQNDTLTVFANGKLTVGNKNVPLIAQLKNSVTTAAIGSGADLLCLPQDVKLWLTGSYGEYERIRLFETNNIWANVKEMELLPPGTAPVKSVVSQVRTRSLKNKFRVMIFTRERVPFQVEQSVTPSTLKVTLYGVRSNTDWIRRVKNDPLIREMRWEQTAGDVYKLTIELNQEQQWGYKANYEGKKLIIDIKRNPPIAGWPNSALKNISFTLDPAHGPEPGAVGPTGLTAKDVNLQICTRLKRKLEKKGAFVYLTREAEHGIELESRAAVASFIGSDVLLSVDFNTLPDGVNPYVNHGTGTYYYHPMSYKPANIIQRNMLKKLGLPDHGLFYKNLALTRPTDMLAILIKPAFIMHPEEEKLIRSKEFQEKLTDALVAAFEVFFGKQK